MKVRIYLNGFDKRTSKEERLRILKLSLNGGSLDDYQGTIKVKYFMPTDYKIAIDFNSKEDREEFYQSYFYDYHPSYTTPLGPEKRIYWNKPTFPWRSKRDRLLKFLKDYMVTETTVDADSINLNKGDGSFEIAGDDIIKIFVDKDTLEPKPKWFMDEGKKETRAAGYSLDVERAWQRALLHVAPKA